MDGVAVEPWAFRRDTKKRATMTAEELDRFRRRYDIVDEVKPIPGETVFKKVSPSAFWGTPLIGHLNFLGVDTIITCGESTSGCVRASVVDGTTNRIRMIVAEECVRKIALDEFSLRRVGREIMNENGARFAGAEKIDSQLERAKILRPVD